jgi:hypothetical protein
LGFIGTAAGTENKIKTKLPSPGFIVGIPAVPFIIPFLFGVVLLRRAGDQLNNQPVPT